MQAAIRVAVVLALAAGWTASAAEQPAPAGERRNCGTYWTDWVDSAEGQNACPDHCEPTGEPRIEEHRGAPGKPAQYRVRNQCVWKQHIETDMVAKLTRPVPDPLPKNCGTHWTAWLEHPESANPCPENCGPAGVPIVSTHRSRVDTPLQYSVRYQCYEGIGFTPPVPRAALRTRPGTNLTLADPVPAPAPEAMPAPMARDGIVERAGELTPPPAAPAAGPDPTPALRVGSAVLTASDASGFDGTSAELPGGFQDAHQLAGTGTLTGQNTAAHWRSTGPASGTYATGGNSLVIDGFTRWVGGSAEDTLQLGSATLTSSDVTGFDGTSTEGPGTFENFERLVGTGTLTGQNTASHWRSTGSASGTYTTGGNSLVIDGFTRWVGGSAEDTLQLGSATLTSSDVTGFDGTSTEGPGGFENFERLVGTGTLTGQNAASHWRSTGPASGTYTTGGNSLVIDGYTRWVGGGGDDRFDIRHSLHGTIDGGAGTDTLALPAETLAAVRDAFDGTGSGAVTLQDGTRLQWSSIERFEDSNAQ